MARKIVAKPDAAGVRAEREAKRAEVAARAREERAQAAQSNYEREMDELVRMVAARAEKKKREWIEFLAATPNVIEFPSDRRFRSTDEVYDLEHGTDFSDKMSEDFKARMDKYNASKKGVQ